MRGPNNRLSGDQQAALDALVVARRKDIQSGAVTVESLTSTLPPVIGCERLTIHNIQGACNRARIRPGQNGTSPTPDAAEEASVESLRRRIDAIEGILRSNAGDLAGFGRRIAVLEGRTG